ncbi:MAG: molecular chaperone [Plesiomonas sp.]|uniref:molecular chaperone n=1 Tax=Plesiomonas sp. TaxID=2486279 RepID=UPI003F33D2A4
MHIGFDYGTANCSVGHMVDGQPQLLPLEQHSPYLPSMICAPTRESVSEYLHKYWQRPTPDKASQQLLRTAINTNRDEDIHVSADCLRFGLHALQHYILEPDDVYFVKSPKSFLGANGLKNQQIALFEDLVCSMMYHIKQQAEQQLNQSIRQTVIGRPINFQGTGGEEANRQAQGILLRAAQRAGFQDIEFQFEPVAAGLDFEATLQKEQVVLVVDIGGGTTDCSLLLMGPQWHAQADRQHSLLGHSGCRVGGNDLDIALTFHQLMPLLGMGGSTEKGTALPTLPYWNAIAINNVPAQADFYGSANSKVLQALLRDAADPITFSRLVKVYRQRLGYRLVRTAEESKIALSQQTQTTVDLGFISTELQHQITEAALAQAIEQPLQKIQALVFEALASSHRQPDIIYITGGSARSPLLRHVLQQQLPGIPLVGGNDFGSVTAGLTRWADILFR